MENNQLYNLLNLPAEVIHNLDKYGSSGKNTFNIDMEALIQNTSLVKELDKLIAESTGQDDDGMKILWEELNIARQSYNEYQKKGIPDRIFIDTMKFCTRFLNEYYKTYSCYRFAWGWWFPRQLALLEFRIGALEYEYCDGHYISLHIPSDADLTPQSVLKSISQFKDFCRQYYPGWEGLQIKCESWMLSPALKDVLTPNSNILQFQGLFDITETDYESMAILDWVFPGYNKVSEELPENTSLQANMKKYLLNGNKPGWTKGVLKSV